MKKLTVLLIVVVLVAAPVFAGDYKYEGGKQVYIQSGLFGYGLYEDGSAEGFSPLGSEVYELFSPVKAAKDNLDGYKAKYFWGWASLLGSIGLLAIGVATIPDYDASQSLQMQATFLWYLTGALALDIAAAVLMVSADNDLHLAIHEYNKAVCGKQSNAGTTLKLVKNFAF